MKKLIALFAGIALLMLPFVASADDERPISVGELPAVSQQFLNAHFKERPIRDVRVGGRVYKEYTVVFTDGSKVEFARNGAWKEVECKPGTMPAPIIPQPILAEVAARFPGQDVVAIERYKKGYEVSLRNGAELVFDAKFRLLRIDD